MAFHNPYHFVPVLKEGHESDLELAKLKQSSYARHDRYVAGCCSGRVTCKLTIEDPIFIGAKRTQEATPGRPGVVENFELEPGKPGLPASSLRGLISSIAEAASNSALRVLQDSKYSFRKEMADHLSAVGMLLKNGDQWVLRPITVPHFEFRAAGAPSVQHLPAVWQRWFANAGLNCKVFFGDEISVQQNGTTAFPFVTYDLANPTFYYMRLRDSAIPASYNKKGPLVVGLHAVDPPSLPIPEAEYDHLPEDQKTQYTRGILRVLGVNERTDIPLAAPSKNGKKHELFLPYETIVETGPTIPVPSWVVDRFHELADERTEARKKPPYHPYELWGMKRKGPDNKLRLHEGALVYFDVDRYGVVEIALSSIWRGAVHNTATGGARERYSTHDFFRRLNPQSVPSRFHSSPETAKLTTCDQLFGFVEERPKDQETGQAKALAGRLRFSSGEMVSAPEDGPYLEPITLKILDSPKPPCPAMYFRPVGKHAAFTKSLRPGYDHPQGRKFYLHKSRHSAEPWRHQPQERDWDFTQQIQVKPVAPSTVFEFHIDFDNLSPREMGLLLYSLEPTPTFRHKLGMGKPIGLGKVHIEITALELIDRADRYTWAGICTQRSNSAMQKILALRDAFTPSEEIANAIGLLGSPDVRGPVHYPIAVDQEPYSEKELFKWFVNNKTERIPLPPLAGGKNLPSLEPNLPPGE